MPIVINCLKPSYNCLDRELMFAILIFSTSIVRTSYQNVPITPTATLTAETKRLPFGVVCDVVEGGSWVSKKKSK